MASGKVNRRFCCVENEDDDDDIVKPLFEMDLFVKYLLANCSGLEETAAATATGRLFRVMAENEFIAGCKNRLNSFLFSGFSRRREDDEGVAAAALIRFCSWKRCCL